jgi:hypothetical protein
MVVVCALTRFTLYIPVPNVKAEETLKQLQDRVFSVFGYPLLLVSDNGPAFISGLLAEMANFYGFRHVPILPYNAQANGAAEAGVKRIKQLLVRHCQGFDGWTKLLPHAQLQLNSCVHSGTHVSPYMALFGRPPYGIEFLENPQLLPDFSSGSDWLRESGTIINRVQKDVRAMSDSIKEANAAAANERRRTEVYSRTGVIKEGQWVRVIHGSLDDAAYVRKHGHGSLWKHRYKVRHVRPHAVYLEVPKDGSVPVIQNWQLIRKVEPAPAMEHGPAADDPVITEFGIPTRSAITDDNIVLPVAYDPDEIFEVERVLKADKISGRYRLLIKWVGHLDPTFEWRSNFVRNTDCRELLEEAEVAVQNYKDEHALPVGDEDEEDDPVAHDGTDATAKEPEQRYTAYGRPMRARRTERYQNVLRCLLTFENNFNLLAAELDDTLVHDA